ncbi:MAG: DUF1178 family protein [Methyloceanibacter sp.]
MIRYALACDRGHGFDAWFGSSGSYDEQAEAQAIVCPACGSHAVSKAPMAPNLAKGVPAPKAEASPAPLAPQPSPPDARHRRQTYALLRELRAQLKAHADDVGPDFAEEARKMHFGETPARSIYGEATAEEARELADDGIPVCPLPQLPEDHN